MLNGGKIVTATGGGGNAGNISLNIRENINIAGNNLEFVQFIEELTQDEIIANSEGKSFNNDRFRFATPSSILTVLGDRSGLFANTSDNSTGDGGNIAISTEAILGLESRDSFPANTTNDIDASSQFGLDGSINIDTPDVNPIQGVTEFPTNVVESTETSAQACSNKTTTAENGLTIAGKGGIIDPPSLPFNSANLLIDGQVNNYTSAIPQPVVTNLGKIQPARGIEVTENGSVILTAYRTDNLGERLPEIKRNCGTLK